MQRSFHFTGESKRLKQRSKGKENLTSCTSFQTLLKSRCTHQLLEKIRNKNIKKANLFPSASTQDLCQSQVIELKENLENSGKTLDNSHCETPSKRKERQSKFYTSDNAITVPTWQSKSFSQPKMEQKISDVVEVDQQMSLEEMQKKTQEILEMKLSRRTKNPDVTIVSNFEDQIQKDLKKIIDDLRLYQTSNDPQKQNIDVQIQEICQKIKIIERIIAGSHTESQMLKKWYFFQKLSKKQNLKTMAQSILLQRAPNFSSIHNKPISTSPSLYFETTNNASFVKPDKDSYEPKRGKRAPFIPNKQPMGRSTYSTDYLNYGTLPMYPSLSQHKTHVLGCLQKTCDTVYQTDFQQKIIKPKQNYLLDCQRDKYKMTNVSFMPKKFLDVPEQNTPKKSKKKSGSQKDLTSTIKRYESYHKEVEHLKKGKSKWPEISFKTTYASSFRGSQSTLIQNTQSGLQRYGDQSVVKI